MYMNKTFYNFFFQVVTSIWYKTERHNRKTRYKKTQYWLGFKNVVSLNRLPYTICIFVLTMYTNNDRFEYIATVGYDVLLKTISKKIVK